MTTHFTRAQAIGNRAFLRSLAETGNIRLSAQAVGIAVSTLHDRRKRHPGFAQAWAAALAAAQARLHAGGRGAGQRPRAAAKDRRIDPDTAQPSAASHRTRGGEPVVIRGRDGRLQVRAAQPGKLTRECEQAFLAALSATCNVRLSAAAAGASARAFYRRQHRDPAFAREMRLAIAAGYERLETALLADRDPQSYGHDAWRQNEPPPLPALTVAEALQLLQLHHKTAKLWAEYPHMRKKRGESDDDRRTRLAWLWVARQEREAEDAALHKAQREMGTRESVHEVAISLPALDQVRR